jgi:tetratricopeptide (TPR) repeat protein
MGAVTSDQGGDGDGSGPIAEGPDSPPVASADATAEADAATETEGETAADAATETAADAATETAADAATETDAGAESEGEAEGETETEIAEIDPDRSVDSLVREAESLIRNDEVLAAEPLLDRAYELDPRDNHVLAGLARVYIARGDGPRAVEMAEAAVRRRSRRTSYKLLLGQAYEAAGDIENARATYNRVLRDEPRNPFARRRLEGLGE